MDKVINLRVSAKLKEDFDAICRDKFLNGSEQIRGMIESFVEDNEVMTRQEAEAHLNLTSIELQRYITKYNIKAHNTCWREGKLLQHFYKNDLLRLERGWNE